MHQQSCVSHSQNDYNLFNQFYLCLFCLITCFSCKHIPLHTILLCSILHPPDHTHSDCFIRTTVGFKTLSWGKFDIIGALLNMKIKSCRLRSVSILSDSVNLIHQYWNFVYRTTFTFIHLAVYRTMHIYFFYSKYCNLF